MKNNHKVEIIAEKDILVNASLESLSSPLKALLLVADISTINSRQGI